MTYYDTSLKASISLACCAWRANIKCGRGSVVILNGLKMCLPLLDNIMINAQEPTKHVGALPIEEAPKHSGLTASSLGLSDSGLPRCIEFSMANFSGGSGASGKHAVGSGSKIMGSLRMQHVQETPLRGFTKIAVMQPHMSLVPGYAKHKRAAKVSRNVSKLPLAGVLSLPFDRYKDITCMYICIYICIYIYIHMILHLIHAGNGKHKDTAFGTLGHGYRLSLCLRQELRDLLLRAHLQEPGALGTRALRVVSFGLRSVVPKCQGSLKKRRFTLHFKGRFWPWRSGEGGSRRLERFDYSNAGIRVAFGAVEGWILPGLGLALSACCKDNQPTAKSKRFVPELREKKHVP